LPRDVPTGIIQLVLDDHQASFLVQGQEVQSLLGVVETGELLLDDQQLLTQDIRVLDYLLLQVLALPKTQGTKLTLFELDEVVLLAVDLVHVFRSYQMCH
jgi:hypothetical protein